MVYKLLFKKNQKQKGQTLVEGILAIFIILTGVVGMLILGISSLSGSTESLDQVKAINFAREAIEVIRNKRDSNWLAGAAYDTGFDTDDDELAVRYAILNFINAWLIGRLDITGFDHQYNTDWQLFFHTSTSLYNHSDAIDGQGTNFYRVVEFNEICWVNDEDRYRVKPNGTHCGESMTGESAKIGTQVLVHVFWKENNQDRIIILEDRLYDWR